MTVYWLSQASKQPHLLVSVWAALFTGLAEIFHADGVTVWLLLCLPPFPSLHNWGYKDYCLIGLLPFYFHLRVCLLQAEFAESRKRRQHCDRSLLLKLFLSHRSETYSMNRGQGEKRELVLEIETWNLMWPKECWIKDQQDFSAHHVSSFIVVAPMLQPRFFT